MYADVILPLPLGDVFTYRVPLLLQTDIKVGVRVIVQFGVRKFFSALVFRIHNEPPTGNFDIKDIDLILDQNPIVTPNQLIIWQWMADYYCSTIGDVYKAALPTALKLESQTKVSYNPQFTPTEDLTFDEENLLLVLQNNGQINIHDINRLMGKKPSLAALKTLLEKNAVSVEEKVGNRFKQKTSPFVFLHPEISGEDGIEQALQSLGKAPKQQNLFEFFLSETIYQSDSHDNIEKKTLLKGSGESEGILKALVDKNVLIIKDIEISRLDFSEPEERIIHELNEEQQKAMEEIKAIHPSKPILLHGVTSSGKTEIYIHLIEEQIAQGNQVLYIVPEIGLTTQLVSRLKRAFGEQAGVYHSKYNDAERVETWNNILNQTDKSYQLIIGTRSAVFLPFCKLGLVIVDEEHENSFKQFDPAPRYNGRDVAVVIAQIHHARLVMGTATPSFESYYNAVTGKYALIELTKRYMDVKLPKVIISDVKRATITKRMKSILTLEMYEAIQKALANQEQVILFQNRRGFAPFMQCSDCSHIFRCVHCDVSLTYHKHSGILLCHYCGHTQSLPSHCPGCKSERLRTKGYGTEKIEEELGILFPEARIARMDVDSTRSKRSFEKLLWEFDNHKIDILIGTQMITKGLDFDNVSLVGIPDADQILNYPDFRAFERSYQLMVQVSGRAGRKDKQGKVIIQTTQPNHPVFKNIIEANYRGLFSSQITERKTFKYPPYYRLIKIAVKHQDKETVDRGAGIIAEELRKLFGKNVLGPEYPIISRIKNRFQKEILIKLERNNKLSKSKHLITETIAKVKSMSGFTSLIIYADVDPM